MSFSSKYVYYTELIRMFIQFPPGIREKNYGCNLRRKVSYTIEKTGL